jgi:hypothetical protein
MRWWIWQRKRLPVSGKDLEDIRHEIRNAVAGIEYERRKILRAISQASKCYQAMDEHLKRIECSIECNKMAAECEEKP